MINCRNNQRQVRSTSFAHSKRDLTHSSSKSLLTALILLIVGIGQLCATDYYQRQSGNWNNPETWTTETNWPQAANIGTYPQAGDNVHLANNGHLATITLTENAECANLYFDGSEPACTISMGNYNLVVGNSWTSNWSSNIAISQGTGYLQVNGGIPQFFTAKTIANFRVGSSSFSFTQTNDVKLTVTSNYDYYCFQSTTPTGIDASAATKHNATPCNPLLSATSLADFGSVCPNSTIGPNSFTLSGIALSAGNITVAALSGYTYATTAEGIYTTTLSIAQSGGVFTQVVYVKFNPTTATTFNGNIAIGGGGAPTLNVVATGNGSNYVLPTITTPTSTNIITASATLGGTITIPGCASETITERGIYYSTTNGFANGTGTKVSEAGVFGAGTFTLDISGLSPSTTYYFKAFATNSNGTAYSTQATFNNLPKTYYSRQSGNWTSASTWTTEGCGNTINSGTYPQAGDNIAICQQHNITVNTTGLSCNNVDMSAYQGQIILNNDLIINGNLVLSSQSYVTAGSHNLTIGGNFSNITNGYYTRIDYSSGNITIAGNISALKDGYEPFNCTGTGWLIMSGATKTFTVNSDISIPRFKQPATSFTKAGSNTLTVSTSFDQNWGPEAPVGVTIAIPANTINLPTSYYRSQSNGDWNTSSTWQQSTNGGSSWISASSTPVSSDGLVTIQSGNTVTLSGNVTIKNLILNAGATLTISAGSQLTVNTSMTNNGSLNLLSDISGTATIITPSTIAGSGSVSMQQYLGSARNWYLASPISNASCPSGVFYKYNEPLNTWSLLSTGTTLNPMVGLIYQTSGAATVTLSGSAFNNGTVSKSDLSRTTDAAKTGFNLVGNPYPSYVNIRTAVNSAPDLTKTIWYRTRNASNSYVFDTYNTTSGMGTNNNSISPVTGTLAPMQAVWVRVKSGQPSATIIFSNALRSHKTDTINPFRTQAIKSRQLVRLQVSNGINSDETMLVFDPNASNNKDDYDSPKMANDAATPEIYTLVDNEKMAINGMNIISYDTEIPLGFKTDSLHYFTFKVTELSNFGSNIKVILKDNGVENEITDGKPYNFASTATTTSSRFSLIFRSQGSTTALSDQQINNDIVVYKNAENQISVAVNEKINHTYNITVYNSTGQKLEETTTAGSKTILSKTLTSGVYFVEISGNGHKITRKLVIY